MLRSFVVRCLLFATLVVGLLLVVWLVPDRVLGESFQYAIFDKRAALAKPASPGRIILVGGSNVVFGVYSPILEEAFGLPVVNAALHGGHGLAFTLREVGPYVRSGDHIVLLPEYANFLGQVVHGGYPLSELTLIDPSVARRLSSDQLQRAVGDAPQILLRKTAQLVRQLLGRPRPDRPYDRDDFNANFDIVGHWGLSAAPVASVRMTGEINSATRSIIADFCSDAAAVGATCYLSYPSLNAGSYAKTDEALMQDIYTEMRATGLPLVGSPDRYTFPDSLHYDTYYHLGKEAQFERTRRLAEDLRAAGCCP